MRLFILLLAVMMIPAASAFSLSASGWGPYATVSVSDHWGMSHFSATPYEMTAFASATNGPSMAFTMERPAYTTYSVHADPNQNYRSVGFGDWQLMTANVHDPRRGYVASVARLPNDQYAADIMFGDYRGTVGQPVVRYPYGSFQRNSMVNHWGLYGWQSQQVGYGWDYLRTSSAFVR